MAGFGGFLIFLAALAFPFVMMPLMWRRMKRVRARVYDESADPRHTRPWEEVVDADRAMLLGKAYRPNDELIDLGDRANHPHWPLSNQ